MNGGEFPTPCSAELALFAAAQKEMIPSRRGLKWLLADERWWLWSIETQREAHPAARLDRALSR